MKNGTKAGKEVGDWRSETLARTGALIQQADPEVVEEVKAKRQARPEGRGSSDWMHLC